MFNPKDFYRHQKTGEDFIVFFRYSIDDYDFEISEDFWVTRDLGIDFTSLSIGEFNEVIEQAYIDWRDSFVSEEWEVCLDD